MSPVQSSAPGAATFWTPLHGSHAIQVAAATLTFAEPITSFIVARISDAVRAHAKQAGLVKEETVKVTAFEVAAGQAPKAVNVSDHGMKFSEVVGGVIPRALVITPEAIRFETQSYTRWVAFQSFLMSIMDGALPIIANSVAIGQISLEYIDMFIALVPGDQDAGMILDRRSDSIATKAFRRRDPWHSHSGWFERITPESRRLINVDVNVLDANGPDGERRAVTIRTLETEQILQPMSQRAKDLSEVPALLALFDELHDELKIRLRDVLTRDARSMISLGT